MFSPQGPSVRELAMQALASVERGYDLLAPKFDHTPFRTPDGVLDATAGALRPLGPFGPGLDVCCGTGAGLAVLRSVCDGPVVGADFSAGMLAQARSAGLEVTYSGPPAIPYMTFEDDGGRHDRMKVFAGECSLNGVYLVPRHNWFISAAHTEDDIKQTLEVTEHAFAAVRKRFA